MSMRHILDFGRPPHKHMSEAGKNNMVEVNQNCIWSNITRMTLEENCKTNVRKFSQLEWSLLQINQKKVERNEVEGV